MWSGALDWVMGSDESASAATKKRQKVERYPAKLTAVTMTDIANLSSQGTRVVGTRAAPRLRTRGPEALRCSLPGTFVAGDGSVAMLHQSTTPHAHYRCKYGVEGGINMDRGGFGLAPEGTTYACVFDGVSAGGVINAYAAQA